MTVLEQAPRAPEQVQRVLHEAFGAWNTGTSLEEIDRMRAEWDRPWDEANGKSES